MREELRLKNYCLQKLLPFFLFASLLLACKQTKPNNQVHPSQDESDKSVVLGEPLRLSLFGNQIDTQIKKIDVPNEKTNVKTGDVEAVFKINGVEKDIPIQVVSSPVLLKEKEYVDVHLLIEAKPNQWKKWEKTISLRRLEDEEASLPKIKLEQLKIDGIEVSLADLKALKVKVPYEKERLERNDIEAKFSLNGKEENVEIEVQPVELEDKQSAKLIINAKNKAKKYKGDSYIVSVTRDDPVLKLKHLTICGIVCDISNTNNISISVEKYIDRVENSNVFAKFDYADHVDEQINVSVSNGDLQEGENNILLAIDASSGQYKRWVQKVKVNRSRIDPEPKLKSLTIFGRQVLNFSLEVPYEKSNIAASDVEAVFVYGIKSPQALEVEVTDGNLSTGSNQVTIKLPAKPNEYLGWTKTITVTRRQNNVPDPEPVLFELRIDGQTEGTNVSDPSNIIANVNYKKANIQTSDIHAQFKLNGVISDVEYGLETEPVEIKQGGEAALVLKVEAKPGYYTAKSWTISILRDNTPPSLILKSLKIHEESVDTNTWTATVPNNARTVLSTNVKAEFEFKSITEEYVVIVENSPVKLEENVAKKIVLKVAGTDKYLPWEQEVTVTRRGKVQDNIDTLWIGKGDADKLGENKFIAVKYKEQANSYLVNIPEERWNNEPISVVVKGKEEYQDAIIFEDGNNNTAVTNGTSVLKSKKKYSPIPNDNQQYKFKMKHNEVEVEYTVIIFRDKNLHQKGGNVIALNVGQQLYNGVINVYRIVEYAGKRERLPLTITSKKHIKLKKPKPLEPSFELFVELVANEDYTPKSLSVGGTTVTSVTNVELQTQGAFATSYTITSNTGGTITINGECRR